MTDSTNDNDAEAGRPAAAPNLPDAQGRAALLLVESLIHTLVARSVLRLEDAIEVVTVAIDARIEMAEDAGKSAAQDGAVTLLTSIRNSLGTDSG